MRQRTGFPLVWLLLAIGLGLYGSTVVLLAAIPAAKLGPVSPIFPINPFDIGMLGYLVVGLVIATRRRTNPIGWLFLVIGLSYQVFSFASAYVSFMELTAPGSLDKSNLLLWLALEMWAVPFVLSPALLLLFPNGQLLSTRWRIFLGLIGVSLILGLLCDGATVEAGSFSVEFPNLLVRLNLPDAPSVADGLQTLGFLTGTMTFLFGVASIILRMRRSRGDERQQLKWFAFAGACAALVLFIEQTTFDSLRSIDPGALVPADLFLGIPSAVSFTIIPVAAGIAILKYHLYDIDVIIRRTLIYAVLTAFLAGVYFGSVVLLQEALRALTGATSDLAIILSTLLIAALFMPLRQRVQHWIDKRLYRRKYDATQVIQAFGATVRDEVDLNRLKEELLGVVGRTMQPTQVSLWLRRTGGSRDPEMAERRRAV